MGITEIMIILIISMISAIIIGVYIYKRFKGIPTSSCSCGKKKLTPEMLVNEYHKKYGTPKCSCSKQGK